MYAVYSLASPSSLYFSIFKSLYYPLSIHWNGLRLLVVQSIAATATLIRGYWTHLPMTFSPAYDIDIKLVPSTLDIQRSKGPNATMIEHFRRKVCVTVDWGSKSYSLRIPLSFKQKVGSTETHPLSKRSICDRRWRRQTYHLLRMAQRRSRLLPSCYVGTRVKNAVELRVYTSSERRR